VNEQTTYVSTVLDVLLSCAVGSSEYTGCLKSHLNIEIQQQKCRTVTRSPSSLKKRCVLV